MGESAMYLEYCEKKANKTSSKQANFKLYIYILRRYFFSISNRGFKRKRSSYAVHWKMTQDLLKSRIKPDTENKSFERLKNGANQFK